MKAVFDLDFIVYQAGFAGEKRSIEATYKPTGDVFEFANRTEMYGRGKKIGGWLGETNPARKNAGLPEYILEDFDIVDIQSAEPVERVIHTVKEMVRKALEGVGTTEMVGFIGGKDVPLWRLNRSTLLEYKGDRKDALSPIYKQTIIDYLVKKYGATIVNNGFEADDMVVMEAYKNPDRSVIIGVDKDVLGNPVKSYNPNKPEWGVIDGRGFGEVYWDEKKSECYGRGRKFFYFQCINGDSTDNYKANCFSEVKWAKKSSYNAIKDAKSDVECFEIIRDTYQHLYPEVQEVVGWRGDKIKIDWLYVASEIWDMARMWRHPKDYVTLAEVLHKYKII